MPVIRHETEEMGMRVPPVRAAENKATVTRIDGDDKRTLGVFSVTKEDGYSWVCKTLELPDKDNKQGESCILPGEYDCVYTRSPHFSRLSLKRWLKKNPGKTEADCPDDIKNIFTYEILNVKGRAGIRIHSANFVYQLLGCIALGDMHKDIDGDGVMDVIHSGKTMRTFEELMEKKPFKLKVQ